MTSRQLFEYALIELNKVQAPSLILEDYNYFINKAINQYINKVYNLYDVNQQKSDDLRVLKASTVLTPYVNGDYCDSALFNKTYDLNLPDDYLHVLNCVVEYTVNKNFKCYNANDKVHFGAKRLTADMFSQIINNYYMRPSYKNPYFYIDNVNIFNTFPTSDNQLAINPTFKIKLNSPTRNTTLTVKRKETATGVTVTYTTDWITLATLVTAIKNKAGLTDAEVYLDNVTTPTCIYITGVSDVIVNSGLLKTTNAQSLIEKTPELRYGNRSKVRMEIRYGKDDTLFTLTKVYIDYLKSPQFIRLTQDQVDEVEDNSQILEFPDYVCQEITNELIKLLMENGSDPRLQTHIPINQTIANPAQEQQKR